MIPAEASVPRPRLAVVAGVLFLAAGLLVGRRGLRRYLRRRSFERTAFLDGRPLESGERAKLRGRIVDTVEAVPSPLGDGENAFHLYKVQKFVSNTTGSRAYNTIESAVEGGPVLVETGSGRVVVDPEVATIRVSDEHENRTRIDHDEETPSSSLQAFLDRTGLEYDGGSSLQLYDSHRQYVEKQFAIGDEVILFGEAAPPAAVDGLSPRTSASTNDTSSGPPFDSRATAGVVPGDAVLWLHDGPEPLDRMERKNNQQLLGAIIAVGFGSTAVWLGLQKLGLL